MDDYALAHFCYEFVIKTKGISDKPIENVMTRKEARETVFGLVFETEFRTGEAPEEIYETSVENREIPENEYIKKAFFTICEKREEIDALIGEHSTGWKTHRLTNVSRSILRLAVYEMLFDDSIPYSVSINEAVELSKKFDDEKARGFINGVLNSVKNALEAKAN